MLVPVLADPKTGMHWVRGTCQCGNVIDVMMMNDGGPHCEAVLVCKVPGCGSALTLKEIIEIYEESKR